MTPRQFFDKVSEMRRLQKEYFRTRDKGILAQSKMAEHEIDNEIERVNNILAQEGGEQ